MFCINCDNGADYAYQSDEDGVFYHLCQSCAGAFELGQVNPGADLLSITDADFEAAIADELDEDGAPAGPCCLFCGGELPAGDELDEDGDPVCPECR